MKNKPVSNKSKIIIIGALVLSFVLPGVGFTSSNNNSASGFDSPTVKIKEFRETR